MTNVGFHQILKLNKNYFKTIFLTNHPKKSPDLIVKFERILTNSFLILHYKTANDHMHLSKMNIFHQK
jgi:ribonucleotide monophosphatase NagD (HAD superfamily)